MAETTPIYATFSGNCLRLDNGVEINGFPDGTRGKFRVKIVSVEQGMFEHIDEDLDGCINHDYYPVKITTVDLSDGTTRTHLTNDETMFAPGKSGGLPIVEAALRPDGDISVVGEYYTQDNILRSLCHGIKDGNADDIARAARLMAKLVRPGDTLVPIPSRTGVATTAKLLAEAISKVTGAPVADILKGASRKSMYEMKKGGTIPGEEFLGLRLEGEPPENTVFVDNVVATGTTARAALRLVPGSRLIALANASTHQPDWNIPVDFRGKSDDPELNMTESADGTGGVYERIAQKAAELEPFGIGLLQKNCVDSLWKVSEPTGGMMRKATQPIRFIHYTGSPEALESILNAGIRQNICIETSRNDVWANILSKDLLDRNKLFVVFDIPEGTPFSLENNTQAVFFQTIPPEWFVSVNTDIGPRGNTRLLDYIGRHDERWPEQRVREFFDDPENADIWSYITRPTLDRLLKLYTGFDIRHDGTQELTEGISMVAAAFVEGITEKDLALDRYLKGMQADVPPQPEGVAGSAQAYYYMLGRKPNETADLLSAVAKASAPEIEKALGPGTHEAAEKLAREMKADYNGLKPEMLERAASLYREGKVADGFQEARGAMEDFAFNHMCYAVSKVWNAGDDKGSLSVDSSLGRRVVRNTWLVHGTTPESAVSIAKRGFDRGNKLGMLAYNLSDGADGQKHDYSGDYLFAFDAGDDIHGSGETSVDLDKYGDALVVFRGSGYKAFHHGDNEYQVIFDYHEPKACFLVISSSTAAGLGLPVRKAGENAMAIYNDQVFGQKDGKPVPLFAAQHANDCVDWIVAHGEQYRNFMFRWGTENKNMTEGISMIAAAFVESASDERIMRIASQLADKFLTPDTVKAISDKFDDMEYLSVFGTDDDFRITKEIKEPFHIVITAALESAVGGKDAGKRKAVTYYGNPPRITLFLSDSTGKPMSAYGLRRYTKMDRNFEDLRKRLVSSWREVLIHELSHALDQLTRGSNRFNPHSRQSMLKSARNASDSYANNLLETNARIPQLGNMLCIRTLERPQAGAQAFPSFNDAVRLFDEIMPFSRMTDDTKRRTVKRMHDIWARLKGVWDKHHNEIKTVQDFQKFLAVDQDAHIGELLGDCAVLDTVSSGRMKVRRVGDDTYKVVEGDRPGDVGAVVKFSPEPTYNPANPQKIRIDTLTMPDGKKINGATLMVKSAKKENKGMTEGISRIATAFVESAGETVGSAFKLCPADLVAIVARRIGAAADYDGLNYTADPDGMDLYLSNGYMDARLAYDTYCKALRSPTGGAEYPLDETTDLDGITKAIIGDMAPERFEERIAGKYDLGRDLVSCVADDLRRRAERDGKKIRVRNEGRKLSVVNPGVDDNCNSAELEWDPESRKLRCPDSGNEYDLDENTNIRKLGHELYERVGSMNL